MNETILWDIILRQRTNVANNYNLKQYANTLVLGIKIDC